MKEISVMYLLVNKPLMLLSMKKVWLGKPVSLFTHIELFPILCITKLLADAQVTYTKHCREQKYEQCPAFPILQAKRSTLQSGPWMPWL